MKPIKSKTPRSWKQAEAHPAIDEIVPEFHDNYWKYYIMIKDDVDNPVTGEKGGAFFVDTFRELQYSIDWHNYPDPSQGLFIYLFFFSVHLVNRLFG